LVLLEDDFSVVVLLPVPGTSLEVVVVVVFSDFSDIAGLAGAASPCEP
jgi:hypothetical protein